MNSVNWTEQFQDAAFGLMQEKPYPVAGPNSIEALVEIIQTCASIGWRILPLGSGSSFPPNFALKTERTFAVTTSRLKEVSRLENGRVFCQAGAPVSKVLLIETPIERKTIGGLLCGTGNSSTRNSSRELWQKTQSIVLADSKGRLSTLPGPTAASYALGHASSVIVESRGKAGILVGIELDATELPVEIGRRMLCSSSDENHGTGVGKQVSYRTLDATSLFDW